MRHSPSSFCPPPLCPPVCRDVSVLSLEHRPSPGTPGGEEGGIFTLRLRSPAWTGWQPGQFVMLRPARVSRPDVFWGRPFSIARSDEEELCLMFQAVGRGTRELRDLERGGQLTVWGPLGNAFAVSPSGPTLLVAGGIGIVPFAGYIAKHPAPETLSLEFGHRLPRDCYPFEDCLRMGRSGFTARNHFESSPGDLERFLAVLDGGIRDIAGQDGLVLACGPLPLLRSVWRFALAHGARAQLSLETRMACGVGACLGCVVKEKTTGGDRGDSSVASYVQTCARGPVFWADSLELEDAEGGEHA